jgi:hypothetical protein
MSDEIHTLAKQIEDTAKQALVLYTPIVEDIIDNRVTDQDRIEHTLDYMLDFCFDDSFLPLFQKLYCAQSAL